MVHRGFARRTDALLGRVRPFLREHDSFIVAGHSMGSACAVLAASSLVAADASTSVDAVFTFGMPRMATRRFVDFYRTQGLEDVSFHFATPRDPVVHRIPYIYQTPGPYIRVPCDEADAWGHHDMRAYREVWRRRPLTFIEDASRRSPPETGAG